MNKLRKSQSGFSLVELMIVLVIIGILAAVGVPIYTGNIKKAKQSEADATMGMIRTQLRVYYAENATYPTNVVAATEDAVTDVTVLNFVAENLTGKYFAAASYTYLFETATTFTLTCAQGSVLDADRILDEAGTFAGGNS
ncbi:MAG: prepilin-type N-terminal cleavage/methylation domain-containing protein [Candidatus Marinimicrobia bacterium]|nr:prepilin-type N-terminal cleavage/methylation domain-containing protein [Candidatus Neomarinimicrobiota bacterium]